MQSCMQLVARSYKLSGLSVVCTCIHGCTLSVVRDVLVATYARCVMLEDLITRCIPSLHEGCKTDIAI